MGLEHMSIFIWLADMFVLFLEAILVDIEEFSYFSNTSHFDGRYTKTKKKQINA